MPGCVLRISLGDADVDKLLSSAPFEPAVVFRVGDQKAQASETTIMKAGFNVVVVDDDSAPFSRQCELASKFLLSHADFILGLTDLPGYSGALDFGVTLPASDQAPFPSFVFPQNLLSASVALRLALGITIYPSPGE